MANVVQKTNDQSCYECYINLPSPRAQDQMVFELSETGTANTEQVVQVIEAREGKDAANKIRQTLNSSQFTEFQRATLQEQWRAKRQVPFMEQSGELAGEFFRDDRNMPDRAKMLETIMDPGQQPLAARYARYQTLLSAARGDPAKMETLRKTVQTWTPDERERFNREAISRASHEEVVAYMETIDRQIQSSQDDRFIGELRQEKKQIFEELAPAEKTRLFKEAALKAVRDGYDTPLEEHRALVAESSPENLELYHGAFQRLIFETSPRNPKDMEEMAQIYSLIPQEARIMYLKTNRQNQKALDHIIVIQNTATQKRDVVTATLIEKDFKDAGMMAEYTKSKKGGGAGLESAGPALATPTVATARREYEEQATPTASQLGGQARRERVSDVNEQVRRTVSATTLDDAAVQKTIEQIRTIDVSALSPEGRTELTASAGSLVARLQNEGKTTQAAEIVKALNIEGAGAGPAVSPALRQTLGERQPTFRGGPVGTETSNAAQQTAPRATQQRPQAPQASPAKTSERSLGGQAQLNQEALRQAREKSGGGGEIAVSPAVKKVIERPIEQAAQAAVEYAKLNPKERIEALRAAPQKIIEMRNEAPAEAQTQIINDIKSSAAARQFESAQGMEGRKNALVSMPLQDQKIVLEAVTDNPLQLTHLCSAMQALDDNDIKQRQVKQQFYENVLAEASEPARRQYAQHVRQEKARAVQENRTGDVERLTREEQVIISKRPLARAQATTPPAPSPRSTRVEAGPYQGGEKRGIDTTQPRSETPRIPQTPPSAPQTVSSAASRPTVDSIKPNGKKPPTSNVAAAASDAASKIVEGAKAVSPEGVSAREEEFGESEIDELERQIEEANSPDKLTEIIAKIVNRIDGLRRWNSNHPDDEKLVANNNDKIARLQALQNRAHERIKNEFPSYKP